MAKIVKTLAGAGFDYSDAPQRSPEWIELGLGKVTSSNLHRWMAVSKRDGKPLKARTDYEREIAFEKAFKTGFSKFVNGAMEEGIINESFLREEYEKLKGVSVVEAGCFYNDYFRASPDGLVGLDGGIELKWLQDTSWTDVVSSGKPYSGSSGDHYLQVQGNLWASGRQWWDYVAGNPNTGRFVVIRILPDEELFAHLEESVVAVKDIAPLASDNLYEFSTSAPEVGAEGEDIWTN